MSDRRKRRSAVGGVVSSPPPGSIRVQLSRGEAVLPQATLDRLDPATLAALVGDSDVYSAEEVLAAYDADDE